MTGSIIGINRITPTIFLFHFIHYAHVHTIHVHFQNAELLLHGKIQLLDATTAQGSLYARGSGQSQARSTTHGISNIDYFPSRVDALSNGQQQWQWVVSVAK